MYTGTQHTVALWKMPGSLREVKSSKGADWLCKQCLILLYEPFARARTSSQVCGTLVKTGMAEPQSCAPAAPCMYLTVCLAFQRASVNVVVPQGVCKCLGILKMWLTSLKLTLPDSAVLSDQRPSDQAAAHPSLAPAAHPRQQHQTRSWGTSSSSRVDTLLPSLPCGSCSHPGGGEEPGRVSCSIWFFAL